MRARLLSLAASLLLAGGAGAETVELRPHPTATGAVVTLADLFAGVRGAAANLGLARAAPPGRDAILDAPTVQAAARQAGYDWPNAQGFQKIIVVSAPPGPRTAGRTPSTRAAEVLVYARNLSAGEILRPEDLRWSTEAIAGGDAVGDADAAIGKAARRPLREGDPAAQHDLAAPVLIRRDDPVNVVFEADGVSLTLQGKALADAARGQVVEVQNPQSKKIIEAVCSGPDQAAVGPRADGLKADASSAPARFAALQ